jgi:hypothetical protein
MLGHQADTDTVNGYFNHVGSISRGTPGRGAINQADDTLPTGKAAMGLKNRQQPASYMAYQSIANRAVHRVFQRALRMVQWYKA